MQQDLREHVRISRDFSIAYTLLTDLNKPDKNLKKAQFCNISAGGVAFEAEEHCNKGDQFLLKITFKGWKKESAEIVRCRDAGPCFSLNAIIEVVRTTEASSREMAMIAGRFTGRLW